MVRVKVLKSFYDLACHKDRGVGEEFDVTEERAAQIDRALPGYILVSKEEDGAAEDMTKLTAAQLKALCEERGIAVPSRAKKADIIALLSKE